MPWYYYLSPRITFVKRASKKPGWVSTWQVGKGWEIGTWVIASTIQIKKKGKKRGHQRFWKCESRFSWSFHFAFQKAVDLTMVRKLLLPICSTGPLSWTVAAQKNSHCHTHTRLTCLPLYMHCIPFFEYITWSSFPFLDAVSFFLEHEDRCYINWEHSMVIFKNISHITGAWERSQSSQKHRKSLEGGFGRGGDSIDGHLTMKKRGVF